MEPREGDRNGTDAIGMDEHERIGRASETPLVTRLYALIEPVVEDLGYRLVRVLFSGDERRGRLQVMAERPDGGMGVEDCARISRELDPLLDVADPIPGSYVLEVSSPGLDRPLTRLGDLVRHAGFEARIEMETPVDGRRRFKGRIGELHDGRLTLETPEGVVELPVAGIARAKLVMNEELLAAASAGAEPRNGPLGVAGQ